MGRSTDLPDLARQDSCNELSSWSTFRELGPGRCQLHEERLEVGSFRRQLPVAGPHEPLRAGIVELQRGDAVPSTRIEASR